MEEERGRASGSWIVRPPRILRGPFFLAFALAFIGLSIAAALALYIAIPCSLTCPPEQRTAQMAVLLPLWWPALGAGSSLSGGAFALAFAWWFLLAWGISRGGAALWLKYG